MSDCKKHKLVVIYGEDIGVTGPTGIYLVCRACKYSELIGYKGLKGDVRL